MTLPKNEQQEIINGLLPLLIPMEEIRPTRKMVYFRKGTRVPCSKKDTDAVPYLVPGADMAFPVNHKNRLKSIIASASSRAVMIDGLSKYLAKHGNQNDAKKLVPYEKLNNAHGQKDS